MKFKRTKIVQFQPQDCSLTLKEALAEFYAINNHLFSIPKPDSKWTELLAHHDVSHVFFGVNTSILDESAGDFCTIFATNMSFTEYLQYIKTPEAKKLIKEIGVLRIIGCLVYIPYLMTKIFMPSIKMKKKWELRGYKKYLDIPLGEIRKIYNLRILEY